MGAAAPHPRLVLAARRASRLVGLAVVSLLAIFTAACLTGERLWRVSPFEGGSASDRVNLWPLAYHNGEETSVLWPLFDVDERGFALRPLVAKDGPAYSVLFPLAAWDTDAGLGWAGPFYWSEARAGLLPLANFGSTSWVGPVWWNEHAHGLFPLARFDGLSYVGPVWWGSDEDGARAGLFPLAMFGPTTSYVGPAWWTRGGDSYGVFPLFGIDVLASGIDHVGPFWWRTCEEGAEAGLFPLVSWGGGGSRFSLLPLYSHDLGPEARTRNVLLGLGHRTRSEAKNESWLLPLFYHRDEPGQADTALLPFFWKRTRGDEADVYTLLGNRSVDPESTSFNLYPLWWSNESKGSSWKMLLPFFYFARAGDERTLITPLGGRGWSATGEDVFVNVLGPLYHHSESKRRDEERTAFLWPLFERDRRGAERATRVAGLYTRTSSPADSATTYAFGLGHVSRTASGRSHRLWPLYSWSNDEHVPGPFYELTLYGRRDRPQSSEQSLFPLFSSARSPSGSAWNALLGLVHHESADADGARSSRSWIWPLASRSRGLSAGFADKTALVGSARWEGGRRFQLGAGLVHSSSRTETAEVQRAKSRTLLFLTHETERLVGGHVPSAEAGRSENRVQHEARALLFGAFLSEHDTYRAWQSGVLSPEEARSLYTYSREHAQAELPDRAATRAILATHGVAPSDDTPESLRRAIAGFAAENTRTFARRHVRIPLVCAYERAQDELEWSGPLGLVHYERDSERARFSLLYYGYRSETKDRRTSRDIFPFLTWDTGPDEQRISFLWRLFHYERQGERRGGHVLFVPWGET